MAMKKIKTAVATGPVLDWMVAKARDPNTVALDLDNPRDPWIERDGIADQPLHSYTPSTDWSQGGPIIDREQLLFHGGAAHGYHCWSPFPPYAAGNGPTHLIAAMRCYVASKLGDEVEVPEELT